MAAAIARPIARHPTIFFSDDEKRNVQPIDHPEAIQSLKCAKGKRRNSFSLWESEMFLHESMQKVSIIWIQNHVNQGLKSIRERAHFLLFVSDFCFSRGFKDLALFYSGLALQGENDRNRKGLVYLQRASFYIQMNLSENPEHDIFRETITELLTRSIEIERSRKKINIKRAWAIRVIADVGNLSAKFSEWIQLTCSKEVSALKQRRFSVLAEALFLVLKGRAVDARQFLENYEAQLSDRASYWLYRIQLNPCRTKEERREIRCILQMTLDLKNPLSKSGELHCEYARYLLALQQDNPDQPNLMRYLLAEAFLIDAIRLTPQYGDSYIVLLQMLKKQKLWLCQQTENLEQRKQIKQEYAQKVKELRQKFLEKTPKGGLQFNFIIPAGPRAAWQLWEEIVKYVENREGQFRLCNLSNEQSTLRTNANLFQGFLSSLVLNFYERPGHVGSNGPVDLI